MKRLKDKFLLRLRNRFQEGTTRILGFPVRFVDKSSFLFMYEEIFEKEIYSFPSRNEAPYILDCGSNIGLSLIYFKKMHPKAELVAFEPDPAIFKVLEHNLRQAGISDAKLVNACLSNKPGQVAFFCEGSDGGKMATEDHDKNVIQVKAITLDSYINKPVDLLKIDIEGAEFDVLEQIQDKLHFVDRLFVEYHSHENQPQRLGAMLQILTDAGFRYHVQSIGIQSRNPFRKIDTYIGLDLQLNIFAYRA